MRTIRQPSVMRGCLGSLLYGLLLISVNLTAQSFTELHSLNELSQEDQIRRSSFTLEEKTRLSMVVRGALKGDYEVPSDFVRIFDDFRVKRIKWSQDQADGLVVQGWGPDLCGATGNCPFLLLDENLRVLLRVPGVQRFAVLPSSTKRTYDVITATHESVFDSIERRFEFSGNSYHSTACSDVDYQNPKTFETMKHPIVTRIPCRTKP